MRTHTLAVGDQVTIEDVEFTILAVEGEDVVLGVCPPEGIEVACDPPELPWPRPAATNDRQPRTVSIGRCGPQEIRDLLSRPQGLIRAHPQQPSR